MRITLLAVAVAAIPFTAQAQQWQRIGSILAEEGNMMAGTWQVNVNAATLQRSANPRFVQGEFQMEFQNRPNCYPSKQDCQHRVWHSYETHRLLCNGTSQVFAVNVVFDPSYSDGGAQPTINPGMVVAFAPNSLLGAAERELCK